MTKADSTALVERLRYGRLSANGPRNPDGPEAATLLESQAATIAELEGVLAEIMADEDCSFPRPLYARAAAALTKSRSAG